MPRQMHTITRWSSILYYSFLAVLELGGANIWFSVPSDAPKSVLVSGYMMKVASELQMRLS